MLWLEMLPIVSLIGIVFDATYYFLNLLLTLRQIPKFSSYPILIDLEYSHYFSEIDGVAGWTEPLGVLLTTLDLCQVIGTRMPSIEAEIMLNLGKVQQQLYQLEAYDSQTVAKVLT